MSKLLGMLMCVGVCLVLGLGSTGCTKKKTEEKTKTEKTEVTKEGKTEIKSKSETEKVETEVKKLTLKTPADVTVKQGDTAKLHVAITREHFTDPVDLKFTGLPDGVSVVEDKTTIAKDATSADLTLKASADAKPGDDQKVTVTASGDGMTKDATFNVSVKKK